MIVIDRNAIQNIFTSLVKQFYNLITKVIRTSSNSFMYFTIVFVSHCMINLQCIDIIDMWLHSLKALYCVPAAVNVINKL